ncbi:MAG: hypothetical protein M3Y45_09560, partial [Actinomycetota bacterium]|nr:hypothetical protein [Actinomycetota bacterium]
AREAESTSSEPGWSGVPALAPGAALEGLARVELMPAAEILAAGGGEGGRISESVLVPLVNQFGIMQQQMLDQFQNAMGMLVEMFGSLQREQMDLIRQELDQLRDVTREFQELKVELATLSRERAQAQASPAPVSPAPAPAVEPEPDAAKASVSSRRTAKAPSSPSPEPTDRQAAAASPEEPSRRAKVDRGDAPDGDVMLWLNQRIATLQEERESRWRKILKLLPNAS